MQHFPVDVRKTKAIRTLEKLGFRVVREGNHISMVRKNPDGSRTPLTMPNHRRIKGATALSLGSPEPIFWRLMNKRKPHGTNCTLIESVPF
jgi:predicted RNA binding protein YcfA (HicA-like mRNA interferase family)